MNERKSEQDMRSIMAPLPEACRKEERRDAALACISYVLSRLSHLEYIGEDEARDLAFMTEDYFANAGIEEEFGEEAYEETAKPLEDYYDYQYPFV